MKAIVQYTRVLFLSNIIFLMLKLKYVCLNHLKSLYKRKSLEKCVNGRLVFLYIQNKYCDENKIIEYDIHR